MARTRSDTPSSHSEDRLTRRSLLAATGGASLVVPHILRGFDQRDGGPSGTPEELLVNAGQLILAFRTGETGLTLARIGNRETGAEHLAHPSQLFGISSGGEDAWYRSNKDFRIERVHWSEVGSSLTITGHAVALPLSFTLCVTSQPREDVALLKLVLRNGGSARLTCRVRAPWIEGLALRGRSSAMWAMLPQEAGGVVSTDNSTADLGMHPNRKIGLPTAMNTMEVLDLYDPNGHGGVFFSDAEADLDIGAAPIQFTLAGDAVCGHSLLDLDPGESRALPAFAIGVHEAGDWHHAVDDYGRRHRPHWNFPDIPSWFRDQGAIYSFSGSGGGAIYMEFPQQDLASRIPSFEQLPLLLEEALQLGTNIVYLWDYWEGTPQGGRPPYWNKGDYIPRADLGGPVAFKNGIRQVHERGGRIILYVEPFIIFRYSQCGQENGPPWAGRDATGEIYHQYPQNYSMVSCFRPWQKFIVEKARTLVDDFGADGIYLDSWGWQLNWPMKTAAEGVFYSPLQYSRGVLELAKEVRQAVRAVRADAIVMGESTSGALSRYWDGGLSADFAWLAAQNQHRIIGSPVRYGMPEVNIFSNGRNLNELNQVFAAGHSLALLNANLPDSPYIRKVVQIRQKYKDALIYGRQICQLKTGNDYVPAYYYRGSVHHVITAANTTANTYSGAIPIEAVGSTSSKWLDLLTGDVLTASRQQLTTTLTAHSLLILVLLEPSEYESQ